MACCCAVGWVRGPLDFCMGACLGKLEAIGVRSCTLVCIYLTFAEPGRHERSNGPGTLFMDVKVRNIRTVSPSSEFWRGAGDRPCRRR